MNFLRVRPLRFSFRVLETVWFPPGKAANTFRGAVGLALRRVACDTSCPGARQCERAQSCAYAQLFEPQPAVGRPSGFADPPRPFVLRAASLDGQRFRAGEQFSLALNIFDHKTAALDYFEQAFEQLATEGVGPDRGRLELVEARELTTVAVNLTPERQLARRVHVCFLTPTELKGDGVIVNSPDFGTLFRRCRDRVAGLASFYQGISLDVDYHGLGERASRVRTTNSQLESIGVERRSSRTEQWHSIGGFVGEAVYEGDLDEFLPYLKAAYWTGVGRFTAWGNGMIAARVL